MQKKAKRTTLHAAGRTIFVVGLTILLMGAALPCIAATPKLLPDNEKLKIQEQTLRIRRLQEGIIDHKIKIFDSRQKERSLLADLEKVDRNFSQKQQDYERLQAEYQAQSELFVIKQDHLTQVSGELSQYKTHVKKRLAAYYRTGPVGLINVLFSAETLPQMLDTQEYYAALLQHDQQAINTYLDKMDELELARQEHAFEKARLEDLVDQVEGQKNQLASLRKNKKSMLTQVKSEKDLYLQAVDEIEKAAADLTTTLENLKKQAEAFEAQKRQAAAQEKATTTTPATPEKDAPAAAPAPEVPRGFAAMKGRLPPPVQGTVVVAFGQARGEKFGVKTFTDGIDFKTATGSNIKAVFDGRIIHAGYMKGYGNMLIIDHGEQYYSLTSGIGRFLKLEGENVTSGETVGITGEDETLLGPGLHFEIRLGANPENPLQWLDTSKLSIKVGQ